MIDVCHLIDDLSTGGAQNLLLRIIRETPDEVSNRVFYLGSRDDLRSKFEEEGIEVHGGNGRFRFDPRAIRRTTRALRDADCDILHTHLAYAQTVGRFIGRYLGIHPIIGTYHDVPANYTRSSWLRAIETATRSLDTRAVGVSEGMTQKFREDWFPPDDIVSVQNGIDVEQFSSTVAAVETDHLLSDLGDDLVYLNIGRYAPKKAQKDLIDAMERVVAERPNSHLFIVGTGELDEELSEKIRQQGLEDAVDLTGRVDDVYEYYAAADVFVFPSLYEGLPLAVTEAMAAGLPVIASDIPGHRGIVDDAGILVPIREPGVLADAMLEMHDDERRSDVAVACFDRVSTEFDISNTVEQYVEIYSQYA
jgi:glycosyltransferase involved in cell wall biosynthesis